MEPEEKDTSGVSAEEAKVAESYYCMKCGKNHRYDSKIGKEHLRFIETPETSEVTEEQPTEESSTSAKFSVDQGLRKTEELVEKNPWDEGYEKTLEDEPKEVELPAEVVTMEVGALRALLAKAPKLGSRAHADPKELAEFRINYAEWLLEMWGIAAKLT